MGKLINLVLILIMIDLLFIITGQLTLDSPSSVIITALTNPEAIQDSNFWTILFVGLSGLALVGGVVAGIVTRSSDVTIFIVMGTSLILMVGDFVDVFNHISGINPVLATVIMSPIILIFTLVVIEWVRGKD